MKKIFTKVKQMGSTVSNFVLSFKKTFSTVHGVTNGAIHFGVIALLFVATGMTSSTMNDSLGTLWGIGTLAIMTLISLVLYIKFIHNAKSFVELLDGFFALLILLVVIVVMFVVGAFISGKVSALFGQEIGWLSFAGFLLCALVLAFKVGSYEKEEGEV